MPYEKCDDEVEDLIQKVLGNWHKDRLFLKRLDEIDIGAIFYLAKTDAEGKVIGPPLKLHGYACAATIKVNSLKHRAQGLADATICIDGESWKTSSNERRISLIDHELEHLERVVKNDAPADDDLGRPLLRVKLHDWQLGGFRVIAERHREAAWEVEMAQDFATEYGQLLFPFAAKAADKLVAAAAADPGHMHPGVAAAVKDLAGKPGESLTIEAGGKSITIDDSNRDRVIRNCDAVINAGRRRKARA
jgi:hypothetical protein